MFFLKLSAAAWMALFFMVFEMEDGLELSEFPLGKEGAFIRASCYLYMLRSSSTFSIMSLDWKGLRRIPSVDNLLLLFTDT